jgi:3-deoxy-D-manno-octulosonic-acid transferase
MVMGPHTFNFSQAAELAVGAGAGFEVTDMAAAVEKSQALLASPPALQAARQSAMALNQSHQGAAGRTALAIKALLLG